MDEQATTFARQQPNGRRGLKLMDEENPGASTSFFGGLYRADATAIPDTYNDDRDPNVIHETMMITFGTNVYWTVFGFVIITRLSAGSYRVQADFSFHDNNLNISDLVRIPITIVDTTITTGSLQSVISGAPFPANYSGGSISLSIYIIESGNNFLVVQFFQRVTSLSNITTPDFALINRQHHIAGIKQGFPD